jgi:2-methylisocitrate lyase-like PEP mutase family enzyme
MLNQLVEIKGRAETNTFYVEEVDDEELGRRFTRAYWREDQSVIIITPPYDPEDFSLEFTYSRRIDLAHDVVPTEADVGTTNFINARVDVYLLGEGEEEERFRNTIDRAHAYRAAGADCIFIPAIADERVIGSLVKSIPGPINILAAANTPPTEVLERLGVARISTGSGPARACATLARRIGRELLDQGTYSSFTHDAMTYKEMNSLFQKI